MTNRKESRTMKRIEHDLLKAPFSDGCPVEDAVTRLATSGIEQRGAVFTRREVVDFILDLVGYTKDQPLHKKRLLEPSFGLGDFLVPAVERLVDAWQAQAPDLSVTELTNCIRAIELHGDSFAQTQKQLIAVLRSRSVAADRAHQLTQKWLLQNDFLLTELTQSFDCVVGNPPYVRQELIPDALIAEYRTRYRTVFDRADIYVPFIEHALELLQDGGALGFICADRWTKNRYGGPLRRMVSNQYSLKIYVDMVNTQAFHSDVIAYPAITIITKERGDVTRIAHRPSIDKGTLSALANELLSKTHLDPTRPVKEVVGVVRDDQPWILDSFDQLELVRRLERDFPTLEETGCKVGIGVATGADKAFIGPFDELDVEDDRKLPLAMTRDILSGQVEWRGFGIVNPFADKGGLVSLQKFPRLRRYLEARKDQIATRHIARKVPANWYRTIDRIYPRLAKTPKLLIPDIKGEAHIVYEEGWLYPHHNLYFITSDEWDLRALQAVLQSGIARLFVSTYSTRMRGGYLRFQAQYLRRIRLPRWQDVSHEVADRLVTAARDGDVAACNEAVFSLYGLSREERATLGGNGAEQEKLGHIDDRHGQLRIQNA